MPPLLFICRVSPDLNSGLRDVSARHMHLLPDGAMCELQTSHALRVDARDGFVPRLFVPNVDRLVSPNLVPIPGTTMGFLVSRYLAAASCLRSPLIYAGSHYRP